MPCCISFEMLISLELPRSTWFLHTSDFFQQIGGLTLVTLLFLCPDGNRGCSHRLKCDRASCYILHRVDVYFTLHFNDTTVL